MGAMGKSGRIHEFEAGKHEFYLKIAILGQKMLKNGCFGPKNTKILSEKTDLGPFS